MCYRHDLQFTGCGCFVLKLTEHRDWLQQYTWTLCGSIDRGICTNWKPSNRVFFKEGYCPIHQPRTQRPR